VEKWEKYVLYGNICCPYLVMIINEGTDVACVCVFIKYYSDENYKK